MHDLRNDAKSWTLAVRIRQLYGKIRWEMRFRRKGDVFFFLMTLRSGQSERKTTGQHNLKEKGETIGRRQNGKRSKTAASIERCPPVCDRDC